MKGYFEAVDTVCLNCSGVADDCESCKVRATCEMMAKDASEHINPCIPPSNGSTMDCDDDFMRFEIFGVPALFVEGRPPETPAGLYRYGLRHGDDDSFPLTLEHNVKVNRFGTVFTNVVLLSEGQEYRVISDEDWGFEPDIDPILYSPLEALFSQIYGAKTWSAFVQYLIDWAQTHADPCFMGCDPACFDEFRGSDMEFYDLDTGKLFEDKTLL